MEVSQDNWICVWSSEGKKTLIKIFWEGKVNHWVSWCVCVRVCMCVCVCVFVKL